MKKGKNIELQCVIRQNYTNARLFQPTEWKTMENT